jgi:RNA polymerase sigma-70 factor (ECF subfamily)
MSAILDQDVTAFEAHRRALMGLAYRMLGSRAEAEDVVQDAYLRWHTADHTAINEPRRYLGTVVTRLCLDRMKSAQTRREIYVGQWLPEPLVDEAFGDDTVGDLAHDISVALMLVLERLSPLERASFLLHDVFGLDFADVSRTLGRGEAACRQLAARAREHIEGRPRFAASREEGHRLAAAFHNAAALGDIQALRQLLGEDVVLYTDGGGKRAAALNPIYGVDKVLRFLAGIARKGGAFNTVQVRAAIINSLAGFVLREEDGSIDTMAFEHRDGRIVAIYVIRNPDKLNHVRF